MRLRPLLEFPLLKRELLAALRTRRAFYLLLVVVAIASFAPLLAWPEAGEFSDPQENAQRFSIFIITQLIVVLLVAPAFTAAAFTTEREENTFELLFSTLLPRWSIVISKLLSSTGYLVLLLAACSPGVSLLYLLGGLEFSVVVDCYLITLLSLVLSSLVCLTASLRSRSTAAAVIRSYLGIVFWNGGLTLLMMLAAAVVIQLGGYSWGSSASGWYMASASFTPFTALVYSIFQQTLGGAAGFIWSPKAVFFVYAGVGSAVQLAYLLWRARSPYTIADVPRRRRRRSGSNPVIRPFRRTFLTKRLARFGELGVPGLANPLFQKALRSEFFSRVRYRWAIFWVALILGLMMVASFGPRDNDWLGGVLLTTMFFALLLAPAVSATGITREIEQGNFDFLRSTRLSTAELVRGKYWSSLYANAGLLAAPVWVFAISLFFGAPGVYGSRGHGSWFVTFIGGMAILVVAYAFAAAVGLVATVLARRSVGALLLAYAALLALCIGYPILAELLDAPSGFFGKPFGCATHPFVALSRVLARPRHAEHGVLLHQTAEWFVFLYGFATVGLVVLAQGVATRRLSRDN